MMNDFKGFKKVVLNDSDYPIWDLWNSSDVIYIQEIFYRDMMEDDIYIKCIRFETDYDTKSNTQSCVVYKDAILSCNALINEDFNEEELINSVEIFNEKVANGVMISRDDIISTLVGAGSDYDFHDEGIEIMTLTFGEDVDLIEEIERMGESVICN